MTTETKTKFEVGAEAHVDSWATQIRFDAAPWFKQASIADIIELAADDWGGSYSSDAVVQFAEANGDPAAVDFFAALQLLRKHADIGFECTVDEYDALKWIAKNRPHISATCGGHAFHSGDRVVWTDPNPIEGQTTKLGTLTDVPDYSCEAILSVDFDDGGQAEVLPHELKKIEAQ